MSDALYHNKKLYGLLAEFDGADALSKATRAALHSGYRSVEAYSPFAIDGLGAMLGADERGIARWTFCGGLAGGIGAYFLQWYTAVIDYPINVGGRPLHSWPAFIPITFEMIVLGAAIAAVIGMLRCGGLPRLRHPLFAAPDFELASRNRFFLVIKSDDKQFDIESTRDFLQNLTALRIAEVKA